MSKTRTSPTEGGRGNGSAADSRPQPQTELPPLDPRVRIGHVHLKVADLDRAIAFYREALGFQVTQKFSRNAAFLSAGGYHHHIGLNTWESAGGSPPLPGATGLYHLAILYPTRAELATALRRLLDADIPLEGAADHGVSEAIYLRDPDGNGVELYWDRPQAQWPRAADGQLAMFTRALDLESLLQNRETSSAKRHEALKAAPPAPERRLAAGLRGGKLGQLIKQTMQLLTGRVKPVADRRSGDTHAIGPQFDQKPQAT